MTGSAMGIEWSASSVLEAGNFWETSRYGPEKALDGNPATAWVEGAPKGGIGESYVIALEHCPSALGFINGYAENRSLFEKNYRIKELTVKIYAGVMVSGFATEYVSFYDAVPITVDRTLRLSDTPDAQKVTLPFYRSYVQTAMEKFRGSEEISTWDFPQAKEMGLSGTEGLPRSFKYILRLEIKAIYPGTTWEDTCLAEIWPDYGEVTDVSVTDDSRALLISTPDGEEIRSYEDFEYVFSLVEHSENGEWAILIKEPAYAEPGRVSTEYAIVHTPTGRDVTDRLFEDPAVLGMEKLPTHFIEKEGKTFLVYDDFESGLTRQVVCPDIY